MAKKATLIIVIAMLMLAVAAAAQDRDLVWDRLDVELAVERDGDILISEDWQVTFSGGPFRFGFHSIGTSRLESISDVRVWADGRELAASYSEEPGTFETSTEDENFFIRWYFDQPVYDSTHSYQLQYTIHGGLRIYEGGDQLWWEVIRGQNRDFPIRSAAVSVHLPEGVNEVHKVDSYFTPTTWRSVGARTVMFQARDIPPGQPLEVRVQFPHGIVAAQPAAWQAQEDFVQQVSPLGSLAAIGLGVFIPLAALLGLYLLWYTRGRDQPSRLPVSYLSDPPAENPPAVVGTLLDEHADMRDIVATLVDLARRGVIRMYEEGESGFLGIGSRRDFVFELVDDSPSSRPYEKILLDHVFGRVRAGSRKKLTDLRNEFYTAIPELHGAMYREVVSLGYFPESPQRTRRIYAGLGLVGLVLAGALFFCAAPILAELTPWAFLPALGAGIAAGVLLVLSR
ncbi:MAG: DUF2207 domain-containing protein, partial [Chloroflexi bacterium]|nr:DUF2207 domain-containing protein [Chloroflexota bacterium]